MESKAKKNTKRHARFGMYFPLEQKKIITEAAKRRGLSVSSFLRMSALATANQDNLGIQ